MSSLSSKSQDLLHPRIFLGQSNRTAPFPKGWTILPSQVEKGVDVLPFAVIEIPPLR
jgi:hypothetical protein